VDEGLHAHDAKSDVSVVVRRLCKTYGERRALDAVDLTIKSGEMVGLIGPSGSGKSTLLRAMAGLVVADRGEGSEVTVFGAPVQANGRLADTVREARAKTGFIFQQFNLVGRLTLFANVMVGALARTGAWRGALGLWRDADKRLAIQALQRVGVAERAGQRASTLSGGQQQRGAVARALVQGARLILADEPVASLDPVASRRVLKLLSDLNREDGVAVVVSLHHVDLAMRWCPRVVALKAGRIVYDGPSAGLDQAQLIEIYGPEFHDAFAEDAAA
jgi:phosphonate transport system ATP-binding protein